jgi:hypothetical protein
MTVRALAPVPQSVPEISERAVPPTVTVIPLAVLALKDTATATAIFVFPANVKVKFGIDVVAEAFLLVAVASYATVTCYTPLGAGRRGAIE